VHLLVLADVAIDVARVAVGDEAVRVLLARVDRGVAALEELCFWVKCQLDSM